jgi:hypothetical protein
MLELRDIFATYFDGEGLTDFALALGVDYENLSGSSKSAKARELALYLWRHSKLSKLAEEGPKRRSDIEWARILGPYLPPGKGTTQVATPQSTKLDFKELQQVTQILADYSMFATPDSRNALLVISGVAPYVNLDLNGSPRVVAASLLARLNEYGQISPGDTAIGRLLAYLYNDNALPPAQKEVLSGIAAKHGLTLTQ